MNKIFGMLNAVQSSGENSYMKAIQEKAQQSSSSEYNH